jgi:hypothetical protein
MIFFTGKDYRASLDGKSLGVYQTLREANNAIDRAVFRSGK